LYRSALKQSASDPNHRLWLLHVRKEKLASSKGPKILLPV
jgi:hypothetical protein